MLMIVVTQHFGGDNMKVEFIAYPFVYADGRKIHVYDIKGTPRVGSELKVVLDGYVVESGNYDPDCVGSVCPIK